MKHCKECINFRSDEKCGEWCFWTCETTTAESEACEECFVQRKDLCETCTHYCEDGYCFMESKKKQNNDSCVYYRKKIEGDKSVVGDLVTSYHWTSSCEFCKDFKPIGNCMFICKRDGTTYDPFRHKFCEHFERKTEDDKPKVRGYAKEADARKLKQIVKGIGEVCKQHNCPDCPLFPLHAETDGKACDFFFREPINPKGNQ